MLFVLSKQIRARSKDQALVNLAKGTTAELRKSPMGKVNQIPTEERGWIYLERFCSMVKVTEERVHSSMTSVEMS